MSCTLLPRQSYSTDLCKAILLHVIRVCIILPCLYKHGGGGQTVKDVLQINHSNNDTNSCCRDHEFHCNSDSARKYIY